MKKASTITVTINFTDSDGQPLDLTGAVINFMIKAMQSDADGAALINKTSTTDIQIASPLTGVATCKITATEANTIPNNKPLYSEAMAFYSADNTVVRTETQEFVLINNLIKAIS
jgi:hypothetical protein